MTRFFKDLKKYLHYAGYSAKAALNAEVAGSYLNWLWWIFNPLCMMLIYTIVFGYLFNASEPNFPIFIFIGLTAWDYFNHTVTTSVKIIKNNKAIVTKVYLPKFILIVQTIMVNFIKMLFSIGVIVVMMFVFHVQISLKILWIFPLLGTFTIFIFAVGTVLLHYGVFVEDLSNVVRIILRFVYYLTGIFFSVEKRFPAPASHYIVRLNPLSYFITAARNIVIYDKAPMAKWMLAWLIFSLILAAWGVHKVYKYENSYAKVI